MSPKIIRQMQSMKRQRGVGVLLVAIVLLGIVTVMTLFSLSAAVYEQRTATNESRYKLAYQTAEAGLDHGLEFIKANTGNLTGCWLFPGVTRCSPAGQSKRWVRCAATDTTVPCGTIQPGNTNSTVRANYFAYTDANSRATGADNKTLNLALSPITGLSSTQVVTQMGDFPVDYEVNALLCLYDTVTPSNQCLTPNEFTTVCGSGNTPAGNGCGSTSGYGTNQFSATGLFAVTLVSRSRLAAASTAVGSETENAQVVLKMTTSAYPVIGSAPDVPLVASSDVTGLGNGDIVANPNGGGTGIPLSIWSAGNIHIDNTSGGSNASFATCFPDEFFKTGTATQDAGGSTVCPNSGSGACSCSKIANMAGNNSSPFGLGVLSGHFGGNELTGPDILGVGVNGILPDNQFFPLHSQNTAGAYLNNPPNQLDNTPFEYVFGTNVADSNSVLLPSSNDATVDAATDWLETHAIHWADCSTLSSVPAGFYWHRPADGACTLPNAQVGTSDAPVVLITQSDLRLSGQTVFFGIIFVRSPALVNQSVVSSGTYNIQVTGGPQVYGAMVLEGSVSPGGSMQLIYDANVLYNVVHGSGNITMGTLPGSWSDAGRVDMSGGSAGTYSE